MTKDYSALIEIQKQKLLKALAHLSYSYKKVQVLPTDSTQLNEETLETWESFAVRFGRVVDLFLMKYLRACILREDPGFSGSLRDLVNLAEKLGLIIQADRWMELRELRNISAHEYTEEDLGAFFKRLRQECPILLTLEGLLNRT